MADSKTQLNYCQEVSESIKAIFDLTSRIDERVKNITKELDSLQKKSDDRIRIEANSEGRMKVLESHKSDLESSIKELEAAARTLELKLQQVEIKTEGHDNKWKTIISFGVQIAWVILAAYLLLKLGLQGPAVP